MRASIRLSRSGGGRGRERAGNVNPRLQQPELPIQGLGSISARLIPHGDMICDKSVEETKPDLLLQFFASSHTPLAEGSPGFFLNRIFVQKSEVLVSAEKLENLIYSPGDRAPASGVYSVRHLARHRPQHEAIVIRGEELPACRTCKGAVQYRLLKETDHIHHDWDLAGPVPAGPQEKPPGFDSVRAFPRFDIDLPIAVSDAREAKTPLTLRGHTKDLSEGGMAAVIPSRLPGHKKTFAIRLPALQGGKQINVQARLRYRTGMRHGFEFVRLSGTDREAIRELCARG